MDGSQAQDAKFSLTHSKRWLRIVQKLVLSGAQMYREFGADEVPNPGMLLSELVGPGLLQNYSTI